MSAQQDHGTGFNRREFLKGSSFATLMTMLGGVPLIAQPAPEKEGEAAFDGPKIKVGLIGLGVWGRDILDQLQRNPQAEVAAICDSYAPMVRRSSRKVPEAAKVEDHNAILDNKDIQAVIIATPTHQHKDIAIAAIQAGKHVYCEAPLANTIEDARAIALAAKKSVGQVFQAGLQMRSDPQRHWLMPFIRSGALGKAIMGRSQWHKKNSWRLTSPNAAYEKGINWRLDKAVSLGLAGEIGMHAADQMGWFFLGANPLAVTGFGSVNFWKDGREVADCIQLVVEYPDGVRLTYDSTLANSFEAEFEVYYGSDAAVMIRDSKAWMFKEVDSPLLGWEVYARKDTFHKETGIALVAGGSKQDSLTADGAPASAFPLPPLYYALEAFLSNCAETNEAVEDYASSGFDVNNKAALAASLARSLQREIPTDVHGAQRAKLTVVQNAPGFDAGYAATVLAIKANEAVTKGGRVELKEGLFELA